MLTFEGINTKGERLSLPRPLSALLCRDTGTPADSLTAVFPCALADEIREVFVYKDNKEIFRGIADEQITSSGKAVKTKLVCRSMAALLIDNEACPCTFRNASASLVFSRYAKPLGFSHFTGEDRTLRGEFKIAKGESCWQVVENFCKNAFGTFPSVEGNVLNMQGLKAKGEELVFSDEGMGIPYASLEHSLLRCKLISRVRVKLSLGGEYSTFVADRETEGSGVRRERYLNADELSGKTLAQADRLIESGRLKSEKLTLSVPLCMTDVLGAGACVYDSTGEYKGFYVTGIRYSLSNDSESTKLTLMRKEN